MNRRISIRIVSIVKSRFQVLRLGSFVRSTCKHMSAPLLQDTSSSLAYLPCPLINARQIDLADEGHLWRGVWVVGTTDDLEGVYAILMYTLYFQIFSRQSCLRNRR